MKEHINYTLGFVFFEGINQVLLIEKQKPAFQKGYLNGLGGKQEPDEGPLGCIIREIEEECGLKTYNSDWTYFCTMRCKDNSTDKESYSWDVHCFATILPVERAKDITQKEDEVLTMLSLDRINVAYPALLGNITWLVGMGMDSIKNKAFAPPIIYYTGLSLPFKL